MRAGEIKIVGLDLYGTPCKVLHNRLALFVCYLLDIDLALFSLLLLWKVGLNKSWNTFFVIKVLFYVHGDIKPFATFQYQLH